MAVQGNPEVVLPLPGFYGLRGDDFSFSGHGVCPYCMAAELVVVGNGNHDSWSVDVECLHCGAGVADIVLVEGKPAMAAFRALNERVMDPESKRAAWVAEALMEREGTPGPGVQLTKRQLLEGKHRDEIRARYDSALRGVKTA